MHHCYLAVNHYVRRLENQLELAMKKMVLLESKMTSVDSHHDTRTVDGDLYQRQYISALSDMQTLQTRISTLEYKIKFSHAHLNVFNFLYFVFD